MASTTLTPLGAAARENNFFADALASGRSSLDSSAFAQPLANGPRSPLLRRYASRPPTPGDGQRMHMYAIDQASTKLKIPMSAIQPTKALEDDGLVPGLCRLHLAGRCRQGPLCYQLHADTAVIEALRQQALRQPSCCSEHGATSTLPAFPVGLTVTIQSARPSARGVHEDRDGAVGDDDSNGPSANSSSPSNTDNGSVGEDTTPQGLVLSIHSFSPTTYLWKQYKEDGSANLVVARSKVCRMHQQGLCRFGDECGFLHVCRRVPLSPVEEGTREPHSPKTPLTLQSTPHKGKERKEGTPSRSGMSTAAGHFTNGARSGGAPHQSSSFASSHSQKPALVPCVQSRSMPLLRQPNTFNSGNMADHELYNGARPPLLHPIVANSANASFSLSHNNTRAGKNVHNPYHGG